MVKEISFEKNNGQKIAAIAFIPDGSEEKKYPTAIFAHGFGGCYKYIMHHGKAYAETGIACVLFDFCGGGPESQSDGTLLEMTPLTELSDFECVMEKVAALPFVDSDNIFLQGESMGGLVAALAAAAHPDYAKGLILWYPAFVVPDDSARRYREGDNTCFGMKLCPSFNTDSMSIDVYGSIGKYKGPVIIIHGDADPIVPISYSERAFQTYVNSSLRVIKNAGHGFDGEDSINAGRISIGFINEKSN